MRTTFALVLVVLVVLSAALASEIPPSLDVVPEASVCKDKNGESAGNCSINFHVCGGVYKWKWKYDSTATETRAPGNGKTGHASDFDSGDGAAKQSAVDLLENGLGDLDCNCAPAVTVPIGLCQVRFAACFMFNNSGCLDAKTPSYKAYAFNLGTNNTGSVKAYADPKVAGGAALEALFTAFPNDKKGCGMFNTDDLSDYVDAMVTEDLVNIKF